MRKKHFEQQISLPTLPKISEVINTKRIHSKLQIKQLLPARYPKFDLRPSKPQMKLGPIRIDPRITLTFTQFRSVSMNQNEFLFQKHQEQRLEKKIHEIKQMRHQQYLNEKAKIEYLNEDAEEDEIEEVQTEERGNNYLKLI
ncbi:hypothetical protein pb186bvf_014000 [Paramecium bursaria]